MCLLLQMLLKIKADLDPERCVRAASSCRGFRTDHFKLTSLTLHLFAMELEPELELSCKQQHGLQMIELCRQAASAQHLMKQLGDV